MHVSIVVEAEALAPRALDEEQERALLASRPHERGAQRDDQPRHARQDLVDLRQEDGLAGGQRRTKSRGPARTIVATLSGDLERQARPRAADDVVERRRQRAPRAVVRGEEQGRLTWT